MQYFGGKARTAKHIIPVLESLAGSREVYIEPFVGGAWILAGIKHRPAIACDINEALITMYKALQQGWVPETIISEELYNTLRIKKDPTNPLTAFVGFGCSYSGKYFGGYARGSNNRNYASNACNSVLKKVKSFKGVEFRCCSYDSLTPSNALVYCDPPYNNTTKYYGTPDFNTDKFWQVAREWSKDNTVLVSEYEAPEDFTEVKSIPTYTDIRVKSGARSMRFEKLFMKRS